MRITIYKTNGCHWCEKALSAKGFYVEILKKEEDMNEIYEILDK